MKRINAAVLGGLIQVVFGICYTLQSGIQVARYYRWNFVSRLLLIIALIELGIFVFSYRNAQSIYAHHNKHSFFKLSKWFSYLIVFSWLGALFVFGYGIYDTVTDSKTVAKIKSWSSAYWIVTSVSFLRLFCISLFIMVSSLILPQLLKLKMLS